MKAVAIIPARMDSSRFPGKPLAPLLGRPMIEHVFRRTKMAKSVAEVYVATCDQVVADACERFGAPVLMTAKTHERATDRIAEAASKAAADVYVMVQGDEPMVTPEMIDKSLEPFRDPAVVCVNLAAPIRSEEEFLDPNTIKVVTGRSGDALYFSRAPIPSPSRDPNAWKNARKQVCIIPFRRDFLLEFARLPPTPLEIAESVDMMRALEHGRPVRMARCETWTHAVDTPKDLGLVERLMTHDPLCAAYGAAAR